MAMLTLHYHNRALGQTEPVNIILPEARDEWTGPFPVVYLLHGIGDDHTDWVRRTRIEMYASERPIMVVMPTTPWRSMYVDGVSGPPAATAIARHLVEFIDARFRTLPERRYRAVCGLSMGGYGALHLALKYPDVFGAAASHSGALFFGHFDAAEEPAPDDRAHFLWRISKTLLGEVRSGGPCDLYVQAETVPAQKRPALRIDCGVDDFMIEANRAFHAHLDAVGYAHEYAEHPGAHTWAYWDEHVKDSLDFFARTLGWPGE